jgi:hypothetical protein
MRRFICLLLIATIASSLLFPFDKREFFEDAEDDDADDDGEDGQALDDNPLDSETTLEKPKPPKVPAELPPPEPKRKHIPLIKIPAKAVRTLYKVENKPKTNKLTGLQHSDQGVFQPGRYVCGGNSAGFQCAYAK